MKAPLQECKEQLGMADKMMHFQWIASLIAINREKVSWVIGGPRVNFQQIAKNTLNFEAKIWWTIARHRLFHITGKNILSPFCIALIVGFMAGYEFNIA